MSGYQAIAQRIQSWIYRDLNPGYSLPSERELAGSYSVTRTTIRRALKLLEARSIVEIRHGSGTRVARNLPGKAHFTIGIVTRYSRAQVAGSPIYNTLVSCIENYIVAKGDAHAFLGMTDWKDAGDTIDCWMTIAVDGDATIRRLVATGKPVIAVDYAAHGFELDAVAYDIYGTGFKAAMELIRAGHRRIGFIGERRGGELSQMSYAAHEAYSGFKVCFENLGGAIAFTHSRAQEDIDVVRRDVRSVRNELETVTAIVVCFPDHVDPIIEELGAMNVSVPDDVSILAIGDWVEKTAGGLSVARFSANYESMGFEAVALADRRLRGGSADAKKVMIQRNFIPGDTLAAI